MAADELGRIRDLTEEELGRFKQIEQELMTVDDIKMVLDSNLKIKSHPIPEGMVGNLLTIDGTYTASVAIFKTLERRAKLFKGHTKPPKEEEK